MLLAGSIPAPCRSGGSFRLTSSYLPFPKPTPDVQPCAHGPRGNRAFVLAEEAQEAWLATPFNKGDGVQQSFTLKDPLELFATFSPFQIHCDRTMHQRPTDSPVSQTHRQIERTSSRDYTTDPNTRPPRQRARSNSTPDKRLSTPSHTVVDRKHQDRNTWSAGSPTIQRSPSTLQRTSSIAGRNQSQTNLQLHRSPSNSPTAPANIQRTPSNLPTHGSPAISRRFSKSSSAPARPRPILFYHKHEPHYGFTNFSNHAVKYDGKVYPTSEHLFQSFKVCAPLPVAFRLI